MPLLPVVLRVRRVTPALDLQQELQNLVNLLGIPSSLNFAVMGTVILLGVLADQQLAAYRAKKRAAQAFERLQPEGAEN